MKKFPINKKNYRLIDYIGYKKLKLVLPKYLKHFSQFTPPMKFKRNYDNSYCLYYDGKFICKTSSWKDFKKVFSVDHILIFSSGPSLAEQDLNRTKNYSAFFVNGAVKLFHDIKYNKPAAFFIMDQYVLDFGLELVKRTLNSDIHCAFTPETIRRLCDIDSSLLINRKNLYVLENINTGIGFNLTRDEFFEYAKCNSDTIYVSEKTTSNYDIIGCSLDPKVGLFAIGTVSYMAFQAALYCNPKNIYVLGLDMGYIGKDLHVVKYDDMKYSSDMDKRLKYNTYISGVMEPPFEFGMKIAKRKSINIYNLSPTSRMPERIIKKKNYDEVFKEYINLKRCNDV